MVKKVVDTRFLIEYFYTKNENVKKKVKQKLLEIIKNRQGIIPVIVLSELTSMTCKRRGIEEAKVRYFALLRSGLEIVPIDKDIAYQAGILKCRYPNVPIGDCIIAVVAKKYNANVLTDDPHFDEIKEVKKEWI